MLSWLRLLIGTQASETKTAEEELSKRAYNACVSDLPTYVECLTQGASLLYHPNSTTYSTWECLCLSPWTRDDIALNIAFCQNANELRFSNSPAGVKASNKTLLLPLLKAREAYDATLETLSKLKQALLQTSTPPVNTKNLLADQDLTAARYWLDLALSISPLKPRAEFIRASFVKEMLIFAKQAFHVAIYGHCADKVNLETPLSLSHYYRMAEGLPIRDVFDKTFREDYLKLNLTVGGAQSVSEKIAFSEYPPSPTSTQPSNS
ncbi:MAG: hypothetical protein DHS20C10_03580 [marine bacterium B5-7]|nr:MAG: hypothetical protein DHS20C10_03580 [marine bacterium B5-7]